MKLERHLLHNHPSDIIAKEQKFHSVFGKSSTLEVILLKSQMWNLFWQLCNRLPWFPLEPPWWPRCCIFMLQAGWVPEGMQNLKKTFPNIIRGMKVRVPGGYQSSCALRSLKPAPWPELWSPDPDLSWGLLLEWWPWLRLRAMSYVYLLYPWIWWWTSRLRPCLSYSK